MCRQRFSLTPDDSFATILKNQFCKFLREGKIELLTTFVSAFLFEPNLKNLTATNVTITVGVCIIAPVTIGSAVALERLIFERVTTRIPSWRELVASCVISCSTLTAGFTCSKLMLNPRED